MSCNFWPSTPPAALMSSIAISAAILADLPSDAAKPVSGAWKPTLISACVGCAEVIVKATATAPIMRWAGRRATLNPSYSMALSISEAAIRFVWSSPDPLSAKQFLRLFDRPFGRTCAPPIWPVARAPRGVDAELGDHAILFERLGSIRPHAGNDDKVAIWLRPRGDRPFDRNSIPRIDIVVDDYDLLDQINCRPHREHRLARFARTWLVERDHCMKPAGAAHADSNLPQRRYADAYHPCETGRDRDAAEQAMLAVIARHDDLKERVTPPRLMRERGNHAGAIGLVHAVKLADRPLLHGLGGIKRAFEHALAMRGHEQIGLNASRDLKRFAEERARDRQLIVAEA